jgi:hypothetical protein
MARDTEIVAARRGFTLPSLANVDLVITVFEIRDDPIKRLTVREIEFVATGALIHRGLLHGRLAMTDVAITVPGWQGHFRSTGRRHIRCPGMTI